MKQISILFILFALQFSVIAQTLQNGMYNNNLVNTPTQVEHTGNTIAVTMSDGVKYFTRKNGNTYGRSYTNPYDASMVRYYEVIVLSATSFSIWEVNRANTKQIWTYVSGSNSTAQQPNNCGCDQAPKAVEYRQKSLENLEAHTCTYCSQLAYYQCLYECSTTSHSKQEIEEKIAYLEKLLKDYQSQTVTNATSSGGLKTQQNTICCPELLGKKLTYAKGNSPKSDFTTSNTRFANNPYTINNTHYTLLESLLSDGNLSDSDLKNYMEVITGFDPNVSNYISNQNFSSRINSSKPENYSFDLFLNDLNTNIVSMLPPENQQKYYEQKRMEAMMQGAVTELQNGEFGANSAQLAADLTVAIIEGIAEAKAEKERKEAIVKKMETITPTLEKLNVSEPYKKLKVENEVISEENWIVNSNPPTLRQSSFQRQGNMYTTQTVTKNHTHNASELKNGTLIINTKNLVYDDPFVGDAIWTNYETGQFYKNIEKFDFAKDFTMEMELKLNNGNDKLIREFKITIGKGYFLTIQSSNRFLWLITPNDYQLTTKYGELAPYNKAVQKGDKNMDKKTGNYSFSNSWMGKVFALDKKKYPLDGKIKITITKQGNKFTAQVGEYGGVTSVVNYFPDKYFLGFLIPTIVPLSKKAADDIRNNYLQVEIHQLKLVHL